MKIDCEIIYKLVNRRIDKLRGKDYFEKIFNVKLVSLNDMNGHKVLRGRSIM
jgi:hypothetical protein